MLPCLECDSLMYDGMMYHCFCSECPNYNNQFGAFFPEDVDILDYSSDDISLDF